MNQENQVPAQASAREPGRREARRSQILPLFRNEITKAGRRKLPYFGFLAVGLLCGIIYFVASQLSSAASANGWGYLAFSMQCVFADIGPVFILVFSAMLLAEETGTGTIRAALAAPVHRWELYLAKAMVGLCYTLLLSAAALLYSAALGKIHFQFGPVEDSYGVISSGGRVFGEFLLAYALSWMPLAALSMYGLLISTLVRTPGAAVAVSISSLFLIDFTKHLVGLDPYVFTRYLGYSWNNLQLLAQGMDCQWQPEVWRMLALCGAYAVAAFGAGLLVFAKEDLNH
jgi:ABC-type transport system involved in multi-copper enzyme maturation permease subunit